MTSDREAVVVGLGEILWDMLPEGRRLGGAPANFAFHATRLGREGVVASRVGEDELGREIETRLGDLGLSARALQRDPVRPTGVVRVELDAAGQPRYEIVEGVAWDAIEWDEALVALASSASAVCFGTLAQRSEPSRTTIRRFLESVPDDPLLVFDINLRGAFFDRETIEAGLLRARVAKLNDEEAPVVARLLELDVPDDDRAIARELARRYDLEVACVTRGARGSLLARGAEVAEHPGRAVRVSDTIGAGDAFLAALVHHLLRGSALERAGEAANLLGSLVAERAGATPEIDAEALEAVRR